MAAVGSRLVGQFRQVELPAVEGIQLTHPGTLENLLGDGDDDRARALAVEAFILDDERIAVRVEELGAADELEVLTVDGQLLAAVDFLAVLLGEAGDDGMAEGEVLRGFRLVIRGTDNQLAAGGGDAGRSRHADHAVTHMLDIGDADAGREHDLLDVGHAGAADGHRLTGHDLGREEHLDAQSGLDRLVDLFGVTCRDQAHEGDGQHESEICKYLLHN